MTFAYRITGSRHDVPEYAMDEFTTSGDSLLECDERALEKFSEKIILPNNAWERMLLYRVNAKEQKTMLSMSNDEHTSASELWAPNSQLPGAYFTCSSGYGIVLPHGLALILTPDAESYTFRTAPVPPDAEAPKKSIPHNAYLALCGAAYAWQISMFEFQG